MRLALVACPSTPTNEALSQAPSDGHVWEPMTPQRALEVLRPGDAAIGRLDVLSTLDGMTPGCGRWERSPHAACASWTTRPALLAAHDKLPTARLLRRHDIAQGNVFAETAHALTCEVQARRELREAFASPA